MGIPIIRGFITLIETMIIGIKALNFSADIAIAEEEEKERKEKGKSELSEKEKKKNDKKREMALFGTLIVATLIAIVLFTVIPYALAEFFQKLLNLSVARDSISFNIIAGLLRLIIFLLYLWAITLMKDVKRIFEYHGAEHKSIFSFENGDELNVENARRYTTHHPRCGTSFLFIVMISAMIIYVIADTIWTAYLGHRPPIWMRIMGHLTIFPLIAGISYELIKISGKVDANHWLAKILLAPGLGLQRITTKEPDDEQLEVALVALKEAISLVKEV